MRRCLQRGCISDGWMKSRIVERQQLGIDQNGTLFIGWFKVEYYKLSSQNQSLSLPRIFLQLQANHKTRVVTCPNFISYNHKSNMSAQHYIQHHLNTSKTKQAHIFPKEPRFNRAQTMATETMYQLPSTQSKRATCFGFGNKLSLAVKSSSPPPTTYNLPSEFERKDLKNITSIGEGRQTVSFGSFIWQTLKRTKNIPSPDRYNIPTQKVRIGGKMGDRIKTDYQLKYHKQIPGPGAYKLDATEIANGSYSLSTYKNNTSPRYFTDFTPTKDSTKGRVHTSTICYDIQQKELGHYFNSKYKNSGARTFSKSKRQGMEEKHLLFTPGFKYRRFSEFNGISEK